MRAPAASRFLCLVAAAAVPSDAYRFDAESSFSLSAFGRNLTAGGNSADLSEHLAAAQTEVKHPPHKFDWSWISTNRAQVAGCCLALFVSGILVSAAGIGGGGIYLAAMMLIGGLSPRDAVPLSHAIVLLGAIASLLVNMRSWYSSGNLDVDLDTCRMVVPASLLGTLMGFLMNSRVPDLAILKLLVVVLTVLIGVVVRIYLRQRSEEKGSLAQPDSDFGAPPPQLAEVAAGSDGGDTAMDGKTRIAVVTRLEFLILVLLFVSVDVCSILSFHINACREEKARHQIWGSCNHPVILTFLGRHMQYGTNASMTDWVHFFARWLPITLCLLFAAWYAQFMHVERKWAIGRVAAVQGMGWATGVIAGLAGIGGGLIFSPFFLITMDPLVAVGTSSTCLLFIAASATVQFALTDRIIMSLAAVYGAMTFVASILGTCLVRVIRHRLPMGKSFITGAVLSAVMLTNTFIFAKLMMATGHAR